MVDLEIYEIDSAYIEYLSGFEKHLFRNKKVPKNNVRVQQIVHYMYSVKSSSGSSKSSDIKNG